MAIMRERSATPIRAHSGSSCASRMPAILILYFRDWTEARITVGYATSRFALSAVSARARTRRLRHRPGGGRARAPQPRHRRAGPRRAGADDASRRAAGNGLDRRLGHPDADPLAGLSRRSAAGVLDRHRDTRARHVLHAAARRLDAEDPRRGGAAAGGVRAPSLADRPGLLRGARP